MEIAGGEVFGLGRRALELPSAWGAVVTRADGTETTVPSGGTADGSDARSMLFVRLLPFDVDLPEGRAFTRDGFECRIQVRCRLVLIPDRDELSAFRAAVLAGRRAATIASIVPLIAPAISRSVTTWLRNHDAEWALSAGRDELIAALGDVLRPLLFAAGVTSCGLPEAEVDSPGFVHLQRAREDASRRAGEVEAQSHVRRVAARAQEEHLDRVGDVLVRLRRLAASSPHANLAELIRTFPAAERGPLFETLFREQASRATRWIAAVTGEEVLLFDPGSPQTAAKRFSISGGAGAVRSVQCHALVDGEAALLLGAATGVYRVPIDRERVDAVWVVSDTPRVRGGFNSTCMTTAGLFASHSELGLWRWPVEPGSTGEPWAPEYTRGARAVRNAQLCGAEIFCTVDDRVLSLRPDRARSDPPRWYTGSRSTLTSLCASVNHVFAGTSDGEVLCWSREGPDRPERLHQGPVRPVESLELADNQGVRRLIFADTSPFLYALVLDEGCVTRYEAGGQTVRRAKSGGDVLVGMTELRDRFLMWRVGQPRVPVATVNVAAISGHTIHDVCLIPAVR